MFVYLFICLLVQHLSTEQRDSEAAFQIILRGAGTQISVIIIIIIIIIIITKINK